MNPPPRPRIIVADDEAHIALFLRHHLEKAGYEAEIAADGPAALALIKADPPAAAILDVEMPEMSGPEICAAVRADPRLAGVAVVIVTGHAHDSRRGEIAKAGADWCFTKPIGPSALTAKLAELIAASRRAGAP